MIFVTVGTHEQPFNRLVEYMDEWADGHDEDVIIQTGYSTYVPHKAIWRKLLPYQEMVKNVRDARIVITHGGPSSFIMPLQLGKIPIVMPRKHELGEHVNNHQVSFAHSVADRMHTIIVVEDKNELFSAIGNYGTVKGNLQDGMSSNNGAFCSEFSKIVDQLFKKD